MAAEEAEPVCVLLEPGSLPQQHAVLCLTASLMLLQCEDSIMCHCPEVALAQALKASEATFVLEEYLRANGERTNSDANK